MAFKNAYVNKRMDKKYCLTDIYVKYTDSYYNRTHHTLGDYKKIVIDEELDCWFMMCRQYDDPELDHAKLSEALWILYYKGNVIEVLLDYFFYEFINGVFYDKVWFVLKISKNTLLNEKEVVELLKTILDVYNVDGARYTKKGYKVYVLDKLAKQEQDKIRISLKEANKILDNAKSIHYLEYVARHLDLGLLDKNENPTYSVFYDGVDINEFKDARIIDKTNAKDFLDLDKNTSFKNFLLKFCNNDLSNPVKNSYAADNQASFWYMHVKNEIFKRFMNETSGDIRILVNNVEKIDELYKENIFKCVRNNEKITTIEGLDKEHFIKYSSCDRSKFLEVCKKGKEFMQDYLIKSEKELQKFLKLLKELKI